MRSSKRPIVCCLNVIADGMQCRVIEITATGSMRHRILSLGLIEGTNMVVKGNNPLKKSVQIVVRDRSLELNEELAQKVLVKIGS